MTLKDNCDNWIKYAYKNWLENWIRTILGNKYLSESAQNMVGRMKDASDKGRTEEAWNLMERLKRMSGSFYGTSDSRDLNYHDQWAEIYMECALVAYELGDLTEASKLLHDSTGNFYGNQSLQKAVVYWFLGCIQWQLPAHSEEAVVSWERSVKIIKGAESDSDKEEMCIQVAEQMRQAINTATLQGFPAPPPSLPPVAESADSKRNAARTPVNRSSARLKFLPYFGSIPAGDPAVVDNHPDMVDVDALKIEGRSYKIYGIRNEWEVRMKPSSRYFLAKADGHSMNIAEPVNIEDEDYVLLHNTQEAKNNDIVAAVVFGHGELETATLKRYKVEYGRRILRFESDREEREIPMTERDYIQGVVVAVLKPSDDY